MLRFTTMFTGAGGGASRYAVYFAAEPRACSTGYFARFFAILSAKAAGRSTSHTSERRNT